MMKRIAIVSSVAGLALLSSGCGGGGGTTAPIVTITNTPVTQQFVDAINANSTVSAVPFTGTGFGTMANSNTVAQATAFVNAPNVPFAFTLEGSRLNEYAVNTQTGQLTNLPGAAPALAAGFNGVSLAINQAGTELFVSENNGGTTQVEAFSVNTTTGAATHLSSATTSSTAVTSQVVVAGGNTILVLAEANNNVESFPLNGSGAFTGATAASTFALPAAPTGSAGFAIQGNTFVAVTHHGVATNLTDLSVSAAGVLAQAAGVGTNPATANSTVNAAATPAGIVVEGTNATNQANQVGGATAFVVMADGAIEAFPVFTDGTFGTDTEQLAGTTIGVVNAGNVVSQFQGNGFFEINNGNLIFFATATGTVVNATPVALTLTSSNPVSTEQTTP